MNDYARKFGKLKYNDKNLSGEDVREGLTAIVSVKLKEAQFEGQTKAKLGNTEVRAMVDRLMRDKLSVYLEENPAVAKVIFEKALASSRAREAARKARENARRKSPLDSAQLPGKLADCQSKDSSETEIFIVEGDSAAVTEEFRLFSLFGVKCSMLKKQELTEFTEMTSLCPLSLRSAQA